MADDKPTLTRRRVLGGMATIGVAGALGSGTYALFSDEESSEGNTFAAGALDLKLDWLEMYNGEEVDRRGAASNPRAIFDVPPPSDATDNLNDLKPGDYGQAIISLHNDANPSFIDMTGELTANNDNGSTRPEREVDDTVGDPGAGQGELADALDVVLSYADYNGPGNYDVTKAQEISSGSLADVMADLSAGVELDFNPDTSERDPYPMSTTGFLIFEWELPIETGNEVQTDSAQFSLTWNAVQARHNSP